MPAPRSLTADVLDPATSELGEGPRWDAAAGVLVRVDILGGLVLLADAEGARLATHPIGRHVGAALPAEGGGWLLAAREGFAVLAPDGAVRPLLAVLADRPDLRYNDAACDPAGRAFAGTMAYDRTPGAAVLHRLDPGPRATAVLDRLTISNGLGWSPDGLTMYAVDSDPGVVRAFDYAPDQGTPSRGRTLLEDLPGGVPDGLCVDGDGCLWVAVNGGGAVHRYTPAGALDAVVGLPVPQVTSCCFGGPAGDRLFVTTAREGLDPGEAARQPLAGALFAVDPGVSGPPATPWRPLP